MCVSDLNCSGTQACLHADLSWAENKSAHCDCSPFYGWTGFPECTTLGFSAKFFIVLNSLLASVCWLAVVTALCLYVYVLFRREACLRFNTGFVTFILAILAVSSCAAWLVVYTVVIARPQDNVALSVDGLEGTEKYPDLFRVERAFVALSLVVSTACTLNVSLMWIKVVTSTRSISGRMLTYLEGCRKVVYITELLHIAALVPCFVLGVIELTIFVTFPFHVFLFAVYLYAQSKLVQLLKRIKAFPNTSAKQQEWCVYQIKRVRNTVVLVCTGLVVTIISAFAYSVMYLFPNGWQEFSRSSERIGPLQLMLFFIQFGIVWTCLAVLWYSCNTLLNVATASRPSVHKDHTSSQENGASGLHEFHVETDMDSDDNAAETSTTAATHHVQHVELASSSASTAASDVLLNA